MKRGFYTIMSAQFFSSLADNALFVAAVELLRTGGGEPVIVSLLPETVRASDRRRPAYGVLFVGALADEVLGNSLACLESMRL